MQDATLDGEAGRPGRRRDRHATVTERRRPSGTPDRDPRRLAEFDRRVRDAREQPSTRSPGIAALAVLRPPFVESRSLPSSSFGASIRRQRDRTARSPVSSAIALLGEAQLFQFPRIRASARQSPLPPTIEQVGGGRPRSPIDRPSVTTVAEMRSRPPCRGRQVEAGDVDGDRLVVTTSSTTSLMTRDATVGAELGR